jgi:hypothetical protein
MVRTESADTYVKDSKDPNEVQLPTGDRLLIALRASHSGEYIPTTLLGDLLLDLFHRSVMVEGSVSEIAQYASLAGLTSSTAQSHRAQTG